MKRTLQERFIEALQKKGFTISIKQKSRKYVTLEHLDKIMFPNNYYVGKSGALRQGKTSSGSIAVIDFVKKTLLKEMPE